jgi:predicted GIY-YIG superfamily endonuclease
VIRLITSFPHKRESRSWKFAAIIAENPLANAEQAPTIEEAIAREKALKKWRRA